MADISLIAAVDASLFEAGLDKMKNATAVKSRAMVSELDKIAAAEARINREAQKGAKIAAGSGPSGNVRGGAFGGRNTSYIGGQLAMQAQDVAVMAQMGASTSRIIAQQGSQILSIFGPAGALAGATLAIGAAIVSWAMGTEKAEKKAKALDEQWKHVLATVRATQQAARESAKYTERIGKDPNTVATMDEQDRHKEAMKEIEATRDSGVRAHAREVEEERHAKQMAEINKRIGKEKADAAKKSADEMAQNTAAIKAEQKTREGIALARKSDDEKDAAALAEIAELQKELAQPIRGTDQSKVVESERKRTRIAQLEDEMLDRKEKRQGALEEHSERRGAEQRARRDAEIAALGKSADEIMAADAEKAKKAAIIRGTEQIRAINEQQAVAAGRVGMTGGQEKAERAYNRMVDIGDRRRAAREAEKLDRENRRLGRGGLTPEQRKEVRDAALRQIKGARDKKALVALEEDSIKELVKAIEKLQAK